jgi:ABC-type sugar transport system ATPase subunit
MPIATGSRRRAELWRRTLATLSLRSLSKWFGAVEAIAGIDLDVADHEFVVLVGPSGCGKSTILRMVAGLEVPSSGEVAIDGIVVNEREPKDRDVAMVFQDYALYPHMTVAQNLGFALKYRRVARAEISRRISAVARLLEIEPLLARTPRQLSGGQRQRVAMGRAIVRDPKLFLFDEPLSNLDAKLRVQMRTELKQLRLRVPTTTVYVTHDQVEAMTLADRIVVLNQGRVEQVGTPEEVYETPASTFVAGFMGAPAMNLLPGRVEGSRLVLESGASLDCAIGGEREVWCGVRPEDLRWVLPGTAANGACLAGSALSVEPLGPDTLVAVDVGGAAITCRLPPRCVRAAGEPVALSVDASCIHLFDRATGRRL